MNLTNKINAIIQCAIACVVFDHFICDDLFNKLKNFLQKTEQNKYSNQLTKSLYACLSH